MLFFFFQLIVTISFLRLTVLFTFPFEYSVLPCLLVIWQDLLMLLGILLALYRGTGASETSLQEMLPA